MKKSLIFALLTVLGISGVTLSNVYADSALDQLKDAAESSENAADSSNSDEATREKAGAAFDGQSDSTPPPVDYLLHIPQDCVHNDIHYASVYPSS